MFNNSGWSYGTSAGGGVTVGEAIEATAQYTRLYINSPNGESFLIQAGGLGGGVGLSFLPASITGSLTDFQSAGSSIYTNVNDAITLSDLSCLLMIYSGNLTWLIGDGYGSLILFINASPSQFLYGLIPVAGPLLMASRVVKGYCLVSGAQLSTPNAGIDATGTIYKVSSVENAQP